MPSSILTAVSTQGSQAADLLAPDPAGRSSHYDVAVIGSGPAGMAACIYLARKKLKTLLITKDIGGQTAWSSDVENYLGFTMLTGAELTRHFQDHLQAFGDDITLKLSKDGVRAIVSLGKPGFRLLLADGSSQAVRSVIIASGKQPRQLGIPGELEYLHKGVTYCAWCDGPLFKGKAVAIIGGGNSALDAAFVVEQIATQVYIVNLTTELTADEVMVDKALAAPKIRIINDAQVLRIGGEAFVRSITVQDRSTGKEKDLAVQGVMIEAGSIPADEFAQDFLKLNENHEIIIDKHNMTSVNGIFAAGDVTDVLHKQIIVAAGEGAKAAMECSSWLRLNG